MKVCLGLVCFSLLFGCATAPKREMVDILLVPIPEGFVKQSGGHSGRVFWTNNLILAQDTMIWYDALDTGNVRKLDANTRLVKVDGEWFHLSFGIWALAGSSIEVTRHGGGGGAESGVGTFAEEVATETKDELRQDAKDGIKHDIKDTLRGTIFPW